MKNLRVKWYIAQIQSMVNLWANDPEGMSIILHRKVGCSLTLIYALLYTHGKVMYLWFWVT